MFGVGKELMLVRCEVNRSKILKGSKVKNDLKSVRKTLPQDITTYSTLDPLRGALHLL